MSLAFLSRMLNQHTGKPVVILIDEYDVPLENAYFCAFYQKMADFIRSFFKSALKTNSCLNFAVIAGCLRITKELIFTGLNNLKINSILSENYGEYLGFTTQQVGIMLQEYGRETAMVTVHDWYDGYFFGNKEFYNPWSVLNYTDALADPPVTILVQYQQQYYCERTCGKFRH